ncbi:hypothetical protein MLC59_15605 [Marinobacter bryozoorum]|nr:hypothetical protein [Marinobacter bryozoorum]
MSEILRSPARDEPAELGLAVEMQLRQRLTGGQNPVVEASSFHPVTHVPKDSFRRGSCDFSITSDPQKVLAHGRTV